MGVGVGVGVGVEVGCSIGVTLGSGVGVGCFRRGVTVRTRLKAMLKTTTRPSILKMICCPLPRERLIISLRR